MEWPILPDYGCIHRWPQDGQGFIHPDDVPVATRCFPSERVFRRDRFDGTYYHYSYGADPLPTAAFDVVAGRARRN